MEEDFALSQLHVLHWRHARDGEMSKTEKQGIKFTLIFVTERYLSGLLLCLIRVGSVSSTVCTSSG